MPTITGGEYEPRSLDLSRQFARDRFLKAIEKYAPNVLVSLASEPLRLSWLEDLEDGEEDPDFEAALVAWAEEYNLSAEWVGVVARDTLRWWRRKPHYAGRHWMRPVITYFHAIPAEKRRFAFLRELPDVTEGVYRRASWEERARREFEIEFKAALDRYEEARAEIGKNPEAHGLVKALSHRRLALHAQWAVRYVVTGETLESIGGKSHRRKVSKAVHEFADLIGIEIPDRRGQKPKST